MNTEEQHVVVLHPSSVLSIPIFWKVSFSTSSPLPQISLLLQTESIFQAVPEDWCVYSNRDSILTIPSLKKIIFLNGKKSTTIPAKQQEGNTFLWFSNFQDIYNKI